MKGNCYYKEGNQVWMPALDYNALYKCDLETRETEYVGKFLDGIKSDSWKILDIFYYEEKLLFFSQKSYELWELDLRTEILRHVSYLEKDVKVISRLVLCQNRIWILSSDDNNFIYCMDLSNYAVIEIEWKKAGVDEYGVISFCEQEEIIYTASRMVNNINLIQINCNNMSIKVLPLETVSYINALTVNANELWVLGRNKDNKDVLQRYIMENEIRLAKEYELSRIMPLDSLAIKYGKIFLYGEKVFIVPGMPYGIIVYDLKTHTEHVLDVPDEIKENVPKDGKGRLTKPVFEKGVLYQVCSWNGWIVKSDLEHFNNAVVSWDLRNEQRYLLAYLYGNKTKVSETRETSLKGLIDYLYLYSK